MRIQVPCRQIDFATHGHFCLNPVGRGVTPVCHGTRVYVLHSEKFKMNEEVDNLLRENGFESVQQPQWNS